MEAFQEVVWPTEFVPSFVGGWIYVSSSPGPCYAQYEHRNIALKRLYMALSLDRFPSVRLCSTLSVPFSETIDAWVPLRVLWHLLLVEFLPQLSYPCLVIWSKGSSIRETSHPTSSSGTVLDRSPPLGLASSNFYLQLGDTFSELWNDCIEAIEYATAVLKTNTGE